MWLQVVAQIMDIYMDHRLYHSLGQQHRLGNMVSRGCTDHGGLLRRFSPKKKHPLYWASCHCSEPGQLCSWGVQEQSLEKLQAATHHPDHHTGQLHVLPSASSFSHTCHHCHLSSSSSLHPSWTTLFLYLSHLSITCSFIIVTLESAVCQTVYMYIYFCPNSFTYK